MFGALVECVYSIVHLVSGLRRAGNRPELTEAYLQLANLVRLQDRLSNEIGVQGTLSGSTLLTTANIVQSGAAAHGEALARIAMGSVESQLLAVVLQEQNKSIMQISQSVFLTKGAASAALGSNIDHTIVGKHLLLKSQTAFVETSCATSSLTQILKGQLVWVLLSIIVCWCMMILFIILFLLSVLLLLQVFGIVLLFFF